MCFDNEVTVIMSARSLNEAFARVAVSAFVAPLDPTVSELTDIKTAVSEAITNAIIHGYAEQDGKVYMDCKCQGDEIMIEIRDEGSGIEDIQMAMTPLYTSRPELERSGMGFTVMESFMDEVQVCSEKGKGTRVLMRKKMTRLQDGTA